MQAVLVSLFTLNVVLTILDAAAGYRNSPLYAAAFSDEAERREKMVKDIRFLLPWLVALYTSLNCYAYSLGQLMYVGGMTLLLLADILVQAYAVRRLCGSVE